MNINEEIRQYFLKLIKEGRIEELEEIIEEVMIELEKQMVIY